jgi:hypothetical protein
MEKLEKDPKREARLERVANACNNVLDGTTPKNRVADHLKAANKLFDVALADLKVHHVNIQYKKLASRDSTLERKDKELAVLEGKLKLDRDKFEHQKKAKDVKAA